MLLPRKPARERRFNHFSFLCDPENGFDTTSGRQALSFLVMADNDQSMADRRLPTLYKDTVFYKYLNKFA